MVQEFKTREIASFKHANVFLVPEEKTIIIEATLEHIPFAHFQHIFQEVGEVVRKEGITKLIFDKRSLKVFDPQSMEWYFTQWKEEMFACGLTTHRKIMPKNQLFKYSVDMSRNSIYEKFPKSKFHQIDIRYTNSVEEALAE